MFSFYLSGQRNLNIHEVGIGVGAASNRYLNCSMLIFGENLLNGLEGILTGKHSNQIHITSSPVFSGSYKYSNNGNLFFFSDFAWQKFSTYEVKKAIKSFTISTCSFGVEYHYFQNNWIVLYSGFGIGASMINGFLSTKPDYHTKLLGISFGSYLSGNLELGYGYKGLISCGLSYQFN